jgi:hypothetical protein
VLLVPPTQSLLILTRVLLLLLPLLQLCLHTI